MKFLHTSDWHIGRTFHGQDLLADQEFVLGAIADLVTQHGVDAVLISGDLYDRAVPSPDAVQCASRILQRIRAAGATIIISSGNHDSAPRLGAFAGFLAVGGLHIRSQISAIADPIVLTEATSDGDQTEVLVYVIPYLEPDVAREEFRLPGARSHQSVVAEAMKQIRADQMLRPAQARTVVLAHAFVVGGLAGDSERSIAVGGVESVSADLFDGIDYVALGHLHRRQVIADHLRYSGAPMAYTFTEAGQTKGVWLAEVTESGLQQVMSLDLPVSRPLATVRGRLDQVLGGYPELRDHYLAVELTDDIRPAEPMRKLREIFPYAMKVDWLPAHSTYRKPVLAAAGRQNSDGVIVADFLLSCRGTDADPIEMAWVEEALTAIRKSEAGL